MRIGIMVWGSSSKLTLGQMIEHARHLDARGFDTMWIPSIFGLDAITTAAVLGRETRRIELGTAVVPTHPRHPVAIAQQALTAGAACDGRFTLGIGLSHPPVIENMLGLSYTRRAKHMREYIAVLDPLLRGDPVDYAGEEYRVKLALSVPGAPDVPVLIAALGDRMLTIAGQRATGTILWMAGMRTIETHIAPKVCAAARGAGRPDPRIVAGMHVVLTSDPGLAKEKIARRLERYAQMPSYRAMLETEGVHDLAELALVGDEKTLDAGLARLGDIGVTDLEASIVPVEDGAEGRTLGYLESRLARRE